MHVSALKTTSIHANDDIYQILQTALPDHLPEKSVVAITSKILALCEGSVVPITTTDRAEKQQLIQSEADQFIPHTASKYDVTLTIKDAVLAVSAGIDESNADGQYVLLPRDSFKSAEIIWNWLRETYQLQEVGVLVTDSKTIPLKWGTMGTALGYCGFVGLVNKIGEPDLFGHTMQMTKVNVAEGLAAAAVVEMGEVAESTPLALITEARQLEFMERPLSAAERAELVIAVEDDVYAPILASAHWQTRKVSP